MREKKTEGEEKKGLKTTEEVPAGTWISRTEGQKHFVMVLENVNKLKKSLFSKWTKQTITK